MTLSSTLPYFPAEINADRGVRVTSEYPTILSSGRRYRCRQLSSSPRRRAIMDFTRNRETCEKILDHWRQVQGRPFPFVLPIPRTLVSKPVYENNDSGADIFNTGIGATGGTVIGSISAAPAIDFDTYDLNRLEEGVAVANDLSSWNAEGGASSMQVSGDKSLVGGASVRFDGVANVFCGVRCDNQVVTDIASGQWWTGSAYFTGGDPDGGWCIIDLQFRDGVGTLLGSVNNGFATLCPGPNKWIRIEATGQADPGTVTVSLRVRWNASGTSTDTVSGFVDQVQLEQGESATGWVWPGYGPKTLRLNSSGTLISCGGFGQEVIVARYADPEIPYSFGSYDWGTVRVELEEV